jgi:hypothetical protein
MMRWPASWDSVSRDSSDEARDAGRTAAAAGERIGSVYVARRARGTMGIDGGVEGGRRLVPGVDAPFATTSATATAIAMTTAAAATRRAVSPRTPRE